MSPQTPDFLHRLLPDAARAGVYRIDDEDARKAYKAAADLGYNVFRIDLGRAADARALQTALAHALRFPDWYGYNWDALLDCLTDLSWCEADGHLLILEHISVLRENDPAAFEMFADIMGDAVAYWRGEKLPCWFLLRDEGVGAPDLPKA